MKEKTQTELGESQLGSASDVTLQFIKGCINFDIIFPCFLVVQTSFEHKYIVGSRGASQLGGTFLGNLQLQGIRLISYSLTKLPSCYNKNTCLMLMKHSYMVKNDRSSFLF